MACHDRSQGQVGLGLNLAMQSIGTAAGACFGSCRAWQYQQQLNACSEQLLNRIGRHCIADLHDSHPLRPVRRMAWLQCVGQASHRTCTVCPAVLLRSPESSLGLCRFPCRAAETTTRSGSLQPAACAQQCSLKFGRADIGSLAMYAGDRIKVEAVCCSCHDHSVQQPRLVPCSGSRYTGGQIAAALVDPTCRSLLMFCSLRLPEPLWFRLAGMGPPPYGAAPVACRTPDSLFMRLVHATCS